MAPSAQAPEEQAHSHASGRLSALLRRILRIMEQCIAIITLVLLAISLVYDLVQIFQDPSYFADASLILQNLLSIVVGLEFVKMLLNTSPANILEVLTVAITRYIILSHEDPWSNVACIACIAGLFAIRRFLIFPSPKEE